MGALHRETFPKNQHNPMCPLPRVARPGLEPGLVAIRASRLFS